MAEAYHSEKRGKKCVLHLRVSLEKQVEGYSLDGQRESLKEWAEREGMIVTGIYVDAGKSGKNGAVYSKSCKHGSEGGLGRPAAAVR